MASYPTLLQMVTMAQVRRAVLGSAIQLMSEGRCSAPSTVLMIPYSELNSHFQTMATAAGATTIGRKVNGSEHGLSLDLLVQQNRDQKAENNRNRYCHHHKYQCIFRNRPETVTLEHFHIVVKTYKRPFPEDPDLKKLM